MTGVIEPFPNTQTNNIQVATYTGGSVLEWREVEGGDLPEPRFGLRAAVIDNVIHVTGGCDFDFDDNQLTSILIWDSTKESWQHVGDLVVARNIHAAVAVPSSMIGC